MSKVKKTGKMHYELLYIIPNKYTEDEAVKINEKINKLIKEKDGESTYSEDWGKKKLTYQIKKYSHGYYKLIEFDVDGVNLAGIDRELRLSSEVLRHQIVKKAIKTEEQLKKEKKISEKIVAKSKKKEKDEKEQEKAKDDKKVKLKDLDDKLDKILDTNDLL